MRFLSARGKGTGALISFFHRRLGATSTASAVVFLLLFGLASGAFVSIFAALFFSLSEDISEVGCVHPSPFLAQRTADPPVAGFAEESDSALSRSRLSLDHQ